MAAPTSLCTLKRETEKLFRIQQLYSVFQNISVLCTKIRPHVDNHTIELLASLLDVERRWTARELAAEVGVYHKTVLHILHDILGYRKIAAHWVPHTLSEVQQWQRYAIAQDLLNRYQREGDDFLGRIVTLDETWARSYEPHLKRQSN